MLIQMRSYRRDTQAASILLEGTACSLDHAISDFPFNKTILFSRAPIETTLGGDYCIYFLYIN